MIADALLSCRDEFDYPYFCHPVRLDPAVFVDYRAARITYSGHVANDQYRDDWSPADPGDGRSGHAATTKDSSGA